jgi:hypothetical protein
MIAPHRHHRLRRRRAALSLAATLALTALSAPIVRAAPIFALPCSDAAIHKDWSTVNRFFSSGAQPTGALADMRVRTLRPCTNPSSSSWDMPFVFVTLQRDVFTVDPSNIVQIGYARCGRPSVSCGDIPNDGQMHFVYTRGDNNGGDAWLADGWYHAPVLGHEYRLRVATATSSTGDPVWQYCIRDKASEPSYTCHNGGHQLTNGTFSATRSWSSGKFPWYGAENTSGASQQGVGDGEPHLDVRWMQYFRSSTWIVATPTTCVESAGPGSSVPSAYDCATVSTVDVTGDGVVNDQETLRVWTLDRS